MHTPASVLYVDDEEGDRQAFLNMVDERGLPWNVKMAGTVAEARRQLLDGRFDVVVAADDLGDGDFTELCADAADAPFVLITTPEREQPALNALQRGADDYVVKREGQAYLSVLISALRKSLHRKAVHQKERRLTLDLRDSEQQLRAVFENAASGIMLTDADDRFVAVNERLCEMLGYTRAQLVGMSAGELTYVEDRAPSDDLNARIHAGLIITDQHEKRYVRQDGSLLWVHVSVSAVRDDAGYYLYSVATVVDISARKAVEAASSAAKQSAENARAAAEEASQAKDRFLAVLSHELRTPLAPVATALALLQRDASLSEQARSQVAVMRRNLDRETRLIDDLLDLTRIAHGQVDLERRPVDLRTVLEQAIEVCRPEMDARRLHFGVDADTHHYPLDADARRLEQVFWNLLKNSIKFTPHGGCIGVRCRRDGGQVIVDVIDSGMGIESGVADRMFGASAKDADSRSRRFGGLGLGLAICKAFVEMHGGTITAYSEGPDKGTTVSIRLPVSHASGEAHDDAAAQASGRRRRRPLHILLVEDNGDTVDMMRLLLEQEGHRVDTAADVTTALAIAAEQTFDLLLSDLGLPDRSGLDLMRELRSRGDRLPAIALSGYGQEHDIEQSRQAGFDAHLVKPVDQDLLEGAIAAVVGG